MLMNSEDGPPVTTEIVSYLVGTDQEAADVLLDWALDIPEYLRPIGLTISKRRTFQRRKLFLRNRRIVCGYELLDRQLKRRFRRSETDAVPPTWLTVGKWTARTIGDLLQGDVALPKQRKLSRRLVRRMLRLLSMWRAAPMGRLLVLGNREIFAQVGSALAIFVGMEFEEPDLDFAHFVGKYGDQLLGRYDPNIANELIFPISSVTRDPLSDSMLGALYSYYRALDSNDSDRAAWIMTGNLHLAAYEQHVAQVFVDIGLSFRPLQGLRKLLGGLQGDNSEIGRRPLDMLTEESFGLRMIDLAAASFATRYILSFAVGRNGPDDTPAKVFAPADPLFATTDSRALIAASSEEIHQRLERVWFALDRAGGQPDRSRVRDWRNYSARVSYIANLFMAASDEAAFHESVLSEKALESYLRGRLLQEDGVGLTPKQYLAAKNLVGAKAPPGGVAAAAA
jgi:hypothetical protein